MLRCSMSLADVSLMAIGVLSSTQDCIAIIFRQVNGRCCSKFCAVLILNSLLIFFFRPPEVS